jgi:hypothetical protein
VAKALGLELELQFLAPEQEEQAIS